MERRADATDDSESRTEISLAFVGLAPEPVAACSLSGAPNAAETHGVAAPDRSALVTP